MCPCRPRAILGGACHIDIVSVLVVDAHVQFVVCIKVGDSRDAGVTWLCHVHGVVAIGRVVARAHDPSTACDLQVLLPCFRNNPGDVDANEALASGDEILHAVLFCVGQRCVAGPQSVEHEGIVTAHRARVGQHAWIIGDGHIVTRALEEPLQDRR